MTDQEQDALIAERVMGWQWTLREVDIGGVFARMLTPPEQITELTAMWDGRECGTLTRHIDLFYPSTDPVAALQVKDYMEEVRGFLCEINYFTGPAEPWCVMFKNFHVKVRRVGGTLHEAIVRAVLSDTIMDHLEQA